MKQSLKRLLEEVALQVVCFKTLEPKGSFPIDTKPIIVYTVVTNLFCPTMLKLHHTLQNKTRLDLYIKYIGWEWHTVDEASKLVFTRGSLANFDNYFLCGTKINVFV